MAGPKITKIAGTEPGTITNAAKLDEAQRLLEGAANLDLPDGAIADYGVYLLSDTYRKYVTFTAPAEGNVTPRISVFSDGAVIFSEISIRPDGVRVNSSSGRAAIRPRDARLVIAAMEMAGGGAIYPGYWIFNDTFRESVRLMREAREKG